MMLSAGAKAAQERSAAEPIAAKIFFAMCFMFDILLNFLDYDRMSLCFFLIDAKKNEQCILDAPSYAGGICAESSVRSESCFCDVMYSKMEFVFFIRSEVHIKKIK